MNVRTAYNLPDNWLTGMQVFFNVQNLLNMAPPFANANSASNGEVAGNPIGREFILGFKLNQ